ncbi:MAG: hypothetical protein QOK36_2203 [Gaiellales bacterium]|nr:hypothetical protein [Gaiellales bacterium]
MRLRGLAILVACTYAAGTSTASTPKPPTLPGARNCAIFPATNVWNKRVDTLPAAANSQAMIDAIGADSSVHPDFGSYLGYGIPYNVVSRTTAHPSKVTFDYADESDRVSYPMPAHPNQEASGDGHILVVDSSTCKLYELFDAKGGGTSWKAGAGAVWNLRSNRLRPDGWTSADAAGLPILPGLVRYDEVAAGAIRHALRFTARQTAKAHIFPARHDAGESDSSLPPMGLRVRLKASVDISGYAKQARVVLRALKVYGMILADNGSPWFISGASDRRYNDDELHDLGKLTGSDFEVVDTSGLRNG